MVFTRWAVVYKHNNQPVDGCVYVHKNKAKKIYISLASPKKYELLEVCLIAKKTMEKIVDKITEIEIKNISDKHGT